MSAGQNRRRAQILALYQSGELLRLARQHGTISKIGAACGMTGDALRGCWRALVAGGEVPPWIDFVGDGLISPVLTSPAHDPRTGTNVPELGKWPSVEAFEKEDFAEREVPPPYVERDPRAPKTRITHRLTQDDVPDGSVIGVLSDVHIPHHDEIALRLAVECLEASGCTHILLNGDVADCGPASRHEGKRKRAILEEGDLEESVAPGRWLYEWARTKRCVMVYGNHEAWVEEYIASTPEVRGKSVANLLGLPEHGDGWTILPSMSRIRLGSRCWEHGDGFFKKGNGGQNPSARIKSLAPDQTTSIGHLHRKFAAFWSNEDEEGVSRTRGAYGNGHLSRPESHEEYMGTYLNWQQSFEITRVWWIDGKARFTTDQPEIHRDKNNRPVFEYRDRIYR